MKHSWRGNISMLQCWRMLLLRKSHPSVYWIFQRGQPPAIKGDSQWKGVIKEKRKKRTLKYICKGGIFLINIYSFYDVLCTWSTKTEEKNGDNDIQILPYGWKSTFSTRNLADRHPPLLLRLCLCVEEEGPDVGGVRGGRRHLPGVSPARHAALLCLVALQEYHAWHRHSCQTSRECE